MSSIKTMLHAEIDLSRPVPEVCEVIAHVLRAYPGHERQILDELSKSIDQHRITLDKEVIHHGKDMAVNKRINQN